MAQGGTIRTRAVVARGAMLLGAIAVLASGCAAATSSGAGSDNAGTRAPTTLAADETPTTGGSLVVGVPADTNGWNPGVNQLVEAGTLVGSSMLEPLFTLTRDGEPQPFLAERATPNADLTKWTIELRPDVTFSDGTPLTAEVLKQNIDFYLIAIFTGPIYREGIKSAEVKGPRSVEVTLERPNANFEVTLSQTWMMAPAMLAAEDKGSTHPIGTGPFVFDTWERDAQLTVKRNPTYWRKDAAGRQLPYVDQITFKVLVDAAAQSNALRAGDVDLVLTQSPENAVRGESEGDVVVRDYDTERTFLSLNTSEGEANKPNPFTNRHARRAVAYATDRQAVASTVGEDVRTGTQPWPTGSRWALPEDQTGYPEHDLDKARAEIEAYKKDTGASTLSFSIGGSGDIETARVLQFLEAQYREVGMDVRIQTTEQATGIINLGLGKFSAASTRMFGFSDPGTSGFFFSSKQATPVGEIGFNVPRYKSETMDQHLIRGAETQDFAARKQAYTDLVHEMNDQVLVAWLYDAPLAIIARDDVHGLNGFRTAPFANFAPKPAIGELWLDR